MVCVAFLLGNLECLASNASPATPDSSLKSTSDACRMWVNLLPGKTEPRHDFLRPHVLFSGLCMMTWNKGTIVKGTNLSVDVVERRWQINIPQVVGEEFRFLVLVESWILSSLGRYNLRTCSWSLRHAGGSTVSLTTLRCEATLGCSWCTGSIRCTTHLRPLS